MHIPSCYLSDKLEGRILASKGGKGVFAIAPIQTGETLVVWGGEIVEASLLHRISPEQRKYFLQVEENLFLLTEHEGPADWINHSCQPNCGLSGQIVLVAMRDISVGEEICYDYSMSESSGFESFNCECGSANCRSVITASDWELPELQRRYQGYFSPYLQRKINMQTREK